MTPCICRLYPSFKNTSENQSPNLEVTWSITSERNPEHNQSWFGFLYCSVQLFRRSNSNEPYLKQGNPHAKSNAKAGEPRPIRVFCNMTHREMYMDRYCTMRSISMCNQTRLDVRKSSFRSTFNYDTEAGDGNESTIKPKARQSRRSNLRQQEQ